MKIGPVLRKSQIILAKKSKGGTLLAKKYFFLFRHLYGYQFDRPDALIPELYEILLCNPPEWRYWQKYA